MTTLSRPVLQDLPGAAEGLRPSPRPARRRRTAHGPAGRSSARPGCRRCAPSGRRPATSLRPVVARQHGRDLVALKPALGAELGQHLGIADVGAVAEIAFEQRLDDAVLHAASGRRAGSGDGRSSVLGVRVSRSRWNSRPTVAGGLGDALVHLARALGAAELGEAILGAIDALARHVGIELEGMPGDGEAQRAACPGCRARARDGACRCSTRGRSRRR